MKIFVSSLIAGMEPHRASVKRAIETLGHEPVMAESFGARASSPQIACLQGVRDADLVVSLFGERYGAVQPSGLSATHEEYREARGNKPILPFVQSGVSREPAQQAFIDEGAFQCGYCTAGMIMGTVALLKEIPKPTDVDIVSKMNRHICRCCSYPKYMAAIHRAAEQTRKEAV